MAMGLAVEHFSGDLGGQDWLAARLRDATGIDTVVPEKRPDTDASVKILIDKEIGSQSTERLSLRWRPEGLVLATWPAELKSQAVATYRTGRAQLILAFAAGMPAGWRVRTIGQLAYRFAAIPQRLYLTGDLDLDKYVHGWLGDDFAYVGGHHYDQVRPVLWPWLLEHRYASPNDESKLPGYLSRLGKRDAHLRPGIAIERTWSPAETTSLDHRGVMADELRAAITQLLGILQEPLPPACAAPRP